MRGNVLVDLRNVYDRAEAERAGLAYFGHRPRPGRSAGRDRVSAMSDIGRIVVVGLGYVGLPLAVALARKFEVIGFDVDAGAHRRSLRAGHDRTREIAGRGA